MFAIRCLKLSGDQPANDQPANERQANERPEQEKQYGKLAGMNIGMNTGMETHRTPHGDIRYWVSRAAGESARWLVFLPGMLTDHRLFGAQLAHFAGKANTFVWDGPAHGMSRPYELSAISVDRIARELITILSAENITRPVLVGQSFGGVVAQRVLQLEPALASGFIGIGTMPLTREYWNTPLSVRLVVNNEPEEVLFMTLHNIPCLTPDPPQWPRPTDQTVVSDPAPPSDP